MEENDIAAESHLRRSVRNMVMCVFVCTIYLHYFKTDTVGRLADALLFSERSQWVVSLHQVLENVSANQVRKQKAHAWCFLCEVSSWSALYASCKATSSDFSSQERKQVAIAELHFPPGA